VGWGWNITLLPAYGGKEWGILLSGLVTVYSWQLCSQTHLPTTPAHAY